MATDNIIAKILRDIRVELADEFDKNFERQGFFAEKWQRHKSPLRKGSHILVKSGDLRRSIRAVSDANSVTFSSDLPYAAIHNDGGEIEVTARMKRYFWHKYYETVGGFGRKKNGQLRQDKRNANLEETAELYKHMALMKVGSKITIPRRRFLGYSPEIEKAVTDVIEDNLEQYFKTIKGNDK